MRNSARRGRAQIYLKLAALHRAAGHPGKALASVRQALVVLRDFTSLLMTGKLAGNRPQ